MTVMIETVWGSKTIGVLKYKKGSRILHCSSSVHRMNLVAIRRKEEGQFGTWKGREPGKGSIVTENVPLSFSPIRLSHCTLKGVTFVVRKLLGTQQCECKLCIADCKQVTEQG